MLIEKMNTRISDKSLTSGKSLCIIRQTNHENKIHCCLLGKVGYRENVIKEFRKCSDFGTSL